MDFASYLVKKVPDINRIILYGSVPRGDFDEDSDVDLFIELLDKKKENKIKKIEEGYYKTETYNKWKLKGVDRNLSIIIGDLDGREWKDLKRAIINTGVILYGKYKSDIEKIHSYVLFVLENIKPDKKRIAIFRKLFGFKIKGKSYQGLIDKIKGIKIGKSSILVPLENSNIIKDYLKSKNVTPKIYDLWSDIKIKD